ncbi:hypothetical protein K9M41_02675 [Candidatus Gracilibacteria bacterium]|nr:hypothetical protein [Candidatus Gracilibacteria bacterium]
MPTEITGNDWQEEVGSISNEVQEVRKEFYEKRAILKRAINEDINPDLTETPILSIEQAKEQGKQPYLAGAILDSWGDGKKTYKLIHLLADKGCNVDRFNVGDKVKMEDGVFTITRGNGNTESYNILEEDGNDEIERQIAEINQVLSSLDDLSLENLEETRSRVQEVRQRINETLGNGITIESFNQEEVNKLRALETKIKELEESTADTEMNVSNDAEKQPHDVEDDEINHEQNKQRINELLQDIDFLDANSTEEDFTYKGFTFFPSGYSRDRQSMSFLVSVDNMTLRALEINTKSTEYPYIVPAVKDGEIQFDSNSNIQTNLSGLRDCLDEVMVALEEEDNEFRERVLEDIDENGSIKDLDLWLVNNKEKKLKQGIWQGGRYSNILEYAAVKDKTGRAVPAILRDYGQYFTEAELKEALDNTPIFGRSQARKAIKEALRNVNNAPESEEEIGMDVEQERKDNILSVVNDLTLKENSGFRNLSFELPGTEGMTFKEDPSNNNLDFSKPEGILWYVADYKGQKIGVGIPLATPDISHLVLGINGNPIEGIPANQFIENGVRGVKRIIDKEAGEIIEELDEYAQEVRTEREKLEELNRNIDEFKEEVENMEKGSEAEDTPEGTVVPTDKEVEGITTEGVQFDDEDKTIEEELLDEPKEEEVVVPKETPQEEIDYTPVEEQPEVVIPQIEVNIPDTSEINESFNFAFTPKGRTGVDIHFEVTGKSLDKTLFITPEGKISGMDNSDFDTLQKITEVFQSGDQARINQLRLNLLTLNL